ncbi:MAG: GNAT family N-acetyltransferase [Terrisporobacter sp.]
MDICFKLVNKENIECILNLKIKDNQEGFIESVEECLKEAEELSLWKPVGIYDGHNLIGFAMYGYWESEGTCGRVWLDRFLIDEKFQGKGYSKPVLKELIKEIHDFYNCDEIYLSLYDDNFVAKSIYEGLGFKFNGELDTKGEKIMVLNLKK